MKKKIVLFISIVIIVIIAVISGIFYFNKKSDNKIIDKQNQIIKNIGTSKNNYYVYNKDNEYYIYNINGNEYICYYYILHKNEKSYNEYKDEYRGNIKANLFYDDESLYTRIKVSEGVVEDGFIQSIDNRHKGFKKIV